MTSTIDTLTLIGHESDAALLGIFQVNILHNLVHLLFGVAGLAAAKASWSAARSFLLYGGAIYLVLFVYGIVIDLASALNFVSLNSADNWLHLVLGFGMVLLGSSSPSRRAPKTDPGPAAALARSGMSHPRRRIPVRPTPRGPQ